MLLGRRPHFLGLGSYLIGITLWLAISACRGEATTASSAPAMATAEVTAAVTARVPMPMVATVVAPQGLQILNLPEQSDLGATAAAGRLGAVTIEPSVDPTGESSLLPVASHTPLPTFTPPTLPEAPLWDHYWLNRPVPAGSAVWTDKVYPYGSTRGGTLRTHHGVEFNVPAGTEVMAAAGGQVVVAGADSDLQLGASAGFYGQVVVIELDYSLDERPIYTLYGHLSDILVAVGEQVQERQVIALSGASGVADGAHLHFEVRVGQNSYDSTRNPLLWLYPFSDRGVVAGRVSWPNGSLARGVPINVRRIDASSPYAATTSYADDSVNSDEKWRENFALDDVVAGFYRLTVGGGESVAKVDLWVYPYQTSFVEVVLPG